MPVVGKAVAVRDGEVPEPDIAGRLRPVPLSTEVLGGLGNIGRVVLQGEDDVRALAHPLEGAVHAGQKLAAVRRLSNIDQGRGRA